SLTVLFFNANLALVTSRSDILSPIGYAVKSEINLNGDYFCLKINVFTPFLFAFCDSDHTLYEECFFIVH
ncbi:hypothetical protein NVE80_14615, partial [Escherichia coli]|nr:hypothetical protein [Escherichia coli]